MSYFNDYVKAFGHPQDEWIDTVVRHELNPLTLWLVNHLPTKWAMKLALRTGLVITRSFIPGGHAIHITRHKRLVNSAEFKLSERGWYMVDKFEEKAEAQNEKAN